MTSFSISNKRRITEISAVVLTAIGKFVFMDWLNWRFYFVVTAIISWTVYIIYRQRTNPGIIRYWGFRTDNFKKVLRKLIPFGLISAIVFIGIGLYRDSINYSWHIIPILVIYPVWGVIQQFLLIALTAGNLQDLKGQRLNKGTIILIAALLFASIHYPYPWLIAGTFILALYYGLIYLSERNIYVLGIFHGWLGGIFYYTILDRDPFIELFGKVVHFTGR